MKLTPTKPTETGHYWLLRVGETHPGPYVKVISRREEMFWVCDVHEREYGTPLKWFPPQYKWAGPIPQPEL